MEDRREADTLWGVQNKSDGGFKKEVEGALYRVSGGGRKTVRTKKKLRESTDVNKRTSLKENVRGGVSAKTGKNRRLSQLPLAWGNDKEPSKKAANNRRGISSAWR